MNTKLSLATAAALLATFTMSAVAASEPAAMPSMSATSKTEVTYVAKLHPMNEGVTGLQTTGEARFVVSGDQIAISIDARDLPPGMMHLQHFHGFADNHQATCPTAAADVNGDGIVDLIETEPMSGTTMVPFQSDPVSMVIVTDTYPKASAAGSYDYRKTVSLSALTKAFEKSFHSTALDLDRRVVFIHGVPPSTKLPRTAASLGTIPAQVTLPIACGEIVRVTH